MDRYIKYIDRYCQCTMTVNQFLYNDLTEDCRKGMKLTM